MRRVPITVRMTELLDYVVCFLRPHKIANINVEIHNNRQDTELRDILVLFAISPDILINFGRNKLPMHMLLAYPSQFGSFHTYLERYVDRVGAVPAVYKKARNATSWIAGIYIGRLDVYLKRDSAEDWMRAPLEELDVTYLGKWRLELGMPDGVNVVPRVSKCDQATWDWVNCCEIATSKSESVVDSSS